MNLFSPEDECVKITQERRRPRSLFELTSPTAETVASHGRNGVQPDLPQRLETTPNDQPHSRSEPAYLNTVYDEEPIYQSLGERRSSVRSLPDATGTEGNCTF